MRFLLMMITATMLAATPIYAVSHIVTDTGTITVFDSEEEFAEHLLTKTITDTLSKFNPKNTFNLQYKKLILDSQVNVTIGLPDVDFIIEAPLSVLDNKMTGILFSVEWRF